MALRLSSSLLGLDEATRDFREASRGLRALLLSVEELRIEADLATTGLPDISGALAALARMQRYDACKSLIAAFEEYVEAQVNLRLAEQRMDYEKVIVTHPSSEPEYLRR